MMRPNYRLHPSQVPVNYLFAQQFNTFTCIICVSTWLDSTWVKTIAWLHGLLDALKNFFMRKPRQFEIYSRNYPKNNNYLYYPYDRVKNVFFVHVFIFYITNSIYDLDVKTIDCTDGRTDIFDENRLL